MGTAKKHQLSRWSIVLLLMQALFFLSSTVAHGSLTWSGKASMPTATSRSSCGVVNGKLYVLGGTTDTGATAAVTAYDPLSNGWQNRTPLPETRFTAGSAVIGTTIYVMGGSGSATTSQTIVAYETQSGSSNTYPLAKARFRTSAAALNGKVYIVGGDNPSTIEVFDPVTRQSTSTATLPEYRQLPFVAGVNGRLYIIGGSDSNDNPTNTCWEFNPADSSFTARQSIPVPVYDNTAVAANGKIYLIGGMTSGGYPPTAWTTTVQVFDPVANSWTTIGAFPTSRYIPAIGIINNTLYLAGGDNGQQTGYNVAVNEAAVLPPADPYGIDWQRAADMPTPRAGAAGEAVNGRIFVLGGTNRLDPPPAGAIATVESYDPVANTWQTHNPLTAPRFSAGSAVAGDTVYILGGTAAGASGQTNTVLAYNTTSGATTAIGSLATARFRTGADIIGDKIYVAGGWGDAGVLDSVEEFDVGNHTTLPKAALPNPRDLPTVVAYNGKLFILGGFNAAGVAMNNCWAYDPGTNSYAIKKPMPIARGGDGGAVVLNGRIYVLGGSTSPGPPPISTVSDIQEYDPATDSWSIAGSLATARWGMVTEVVNGDMYVIGGSDNAQVLGLNETTATVPPPTPWTVYSSGPPVANPLVPANAAIDWPAAQHDFVAAGNYVQIAGTYYFVIGSRKSSWNGTTYFSAALQQCNQTTKQPLYAGNGQPLFANTSGTVGMAITPHSFGVPSGIYPLTANLAGTGSGSVTMADGVISYSYTASFSRILPDGMTVSLTAAPVAGASFSGWSGDCTSVAGTLCTVTMTGAKSVTASFATDTIPPVSAIATPANGEIITGTSFTITGTATGAGIAGVEVSTDGGTTWHAATDNSGGAWSSWSYSWNLPAAGQFTLRSRASRPGSVENPSPGITVSVSPTIWTTKAPMPIPISRAVSGVVGDRLYVLGGDRGSSTTDIVQMYNPLNNTWQEKAPLCAPVFAAAGATQGDIIYIAGGNGDTWGARNTVFAYNTATAEGSCSTIGNLVAPRFRMSGAVLNNKLYVVGGLGNSGPPLDTIEEFDLSPGNHASVIKDARLPEGRTLAAVVAVGSKLFIIGGSNATGPTATCWEYDPQDAVQPFRVKQPLPIPVEARNAIHLAGKIYLVGGWTQGGITRAIQVYDIASNSWSLSATIPTSRYATAAETVGGTLYVVGGDAGTGTSLGVNEAWKITDDWQVHSIGTGPPPYPQSPPYAIDWVATQHEAVPAGMYMKIGGSYYFTLGSGGLSGSWNGSGYNAVALQQCNQTTGLPLYDTSGNPLPPDMTGTAGLPITLYPKWPLSPASWTVHSAGTGPPPYPQSPLYAIDWFANEHPLLVPGSYLRIAGVYYLVLGTNGIPGSWSGTQFNSTALQQCDQSNGNPLYDSNGNYLLPDMSATVGQSIALFDSFPVVPPAAPSSEVLYPVNGSVLSSSRYTVTGIASPGGAPAIGKVEISINGGAWTLAAGTGAWTYDWTISGDGTYTLRSRVTDSLGRVETAGTGVTVTVAHGSGTSWGVGYNFNGQLGNNTRTDATWPVQTTGLSGITALATRGNISLGLKADGTVWVWGETSGIAPARVTSLSGMIGVAQGQYDSVALKNDGTVWSWQWGGPPVRVGTLAGIAAIAAGNGHFLALKNDGTVWAWGGNQYGQLGDGTSTDRSTPVQVSGLGGVKAISCGGYHSMALRNDGTVWSWGINQEGQLGAGWGFTEAWSPVAHPNPLQAIGLSNVTAIAGGGSHAAALKSDGTMWVWGWDKMGQLGNGAITVNGYEATGIPQQVPGIYGVTAIAAGNNHTLAVLSNGSLWGWGQGDGGQLGNGRSGCYQCESITSPWQISGFANVVAAAGGSSHTLALQSATPVSAPSSSITSPAWGADITSATVTITGTASGSAGSGVVAVQISTNGGTTWASASGTTPWSYTWTPTADGSVLIKTRALDTAGKMEGPVYGTAVFVDRTAPACTITSPTAGALLTGSAVTVSGTATDGAGRGVTSVEISADGGNNWSTATGTTSWSYSWSLPTDGTYTLLCRATDGVGHAATGTGVAVRVDNLRITSPASGASLGGTSFAITGTASSAGNGVQAVEVSVNGNDGPWAPAAGTSSWSYLWTLPADGSYTIVARATDNLGGQTLSQPVTVLVDNAAPLTLATPPGGAFNSPVRVTLTSSESAAIYYTTDGNAPNTGSARYSAPLTLAATTTLRFFAVDAAGNPEVVKTAQYTVDPVLFQPRSESPVDVGLPVAAGDFTGDGKIDLVAMTIYTAYLIPGNGDGTLGTPRSIWNGDYPSGAAAGDFDGDGKLDLAISSPVTSTISVLYGNDDGSFRSRTDYAAGGGEVAAADLTGDGKADIAVANSGVSVFISNGDGSFQPRADYPAGSAPRAIAAADFDRGGKAGLAVANYNSNSVSVLLNDGSAGFSRRTDYPVGTHPFAVVAGDFNGDGYPDLAVANGDGNSVSILVNRGNGAFMPKVDYAMGTHPYELQVADFNGDGIADLAVGNIITFSILLGNGDGTFQPKLDYAGGSTNIYGLTAADLNGDGRPDLAFTNAGLRKIAVYLNSNRPAPPVTTPSVRSGFYPAAQSVVLTADRPATIYYTTDGRTPTTASAIYAAPIPVAAPTTLRFFAVDAASNAEQVKTCVYTIDATAPAGSLNINGGATFTTSPSVILYVVASDGVGVAQMQFSNDGTTWSYPEPFVASRNWTLPAGWGTKTVFARFRDFAGNWSAQAQASILLNTAPVTTVSPAGGSFNTPQTVNLTTFESAAIYYTTDGSIPTTSSTGYTAPITIAATTTLRFFAVGAGGNQEAVKSQTYIIDQVPPTGTVSINGGAAYTSSSTVTLSLGASDSSGVSQMQFSNNGSTWSEPEPYATSRTWSLIAGDGTKTVFVKFRDSLGNWSPAVSATILLDFSSSFLPGVSYDTWADSRGVVAADFNGDGILDLAVANNDTGTASILIGNSDGTFKPRVNYPAGSGPVAVVAADFNGDGTIDLAVADRNENAVSVLLGNGDGTFRSRSAFTTGAAPCGLAVGDLNGDGRQDLIAANIGGSSLSVLLGNGDGTFAPKADYPVGGPVAVTVADFNGDGKPDLASANYGSATLSVLLGNGDGTFQGSVQYTTGNSPYAVTAADFNRDGKADIAVANYGSNTVSVFLGNGDGSFLPKADFGTGSFPAAVATGDFNGDDIIDLAVANRTGNTVSVLVGNGNGTFQNKVDYPAGTGPTCVVMADFNRDGKADIAVADTGGYWRNGQVTVLTSNIPIRIARSPMVGFQTLQEAYQNVADGDIIQSRSGTITGTLQLTREVTISIKGGYDGKYESNSSYTTIIGDLKISAGTVQVENLNFR